MRQAVNDGNPTGRHGTQERQTAIHGFTLALNSGGSVSDPRDTLYHMSAQRTGPKGEVITMRAEAEMVRELQELAELLSTEFVTATKADALRALVKIGAPILRRKLAKKGSGSTASTQARSKPAARKPRKKQ